MYVWVILGFEDNCKGRKVLALVNFPGASDGRVCLQRGRPGFDPWVRTIPWRRKWQPTPVPLPRKSYGRRSLVGNSPWGRKELDTTERLQVLRTIAKLGKFWL